MAVFIPPRRRLRKFPASWWRAMRFVGATGLLIGVLQIKADNAAGAPVDSIDPCPRPAPGSEASDAEDVRSRNGVLNLDLTIRNHRQPDGPARYCYLLPDGSQSPTLRVHPGDLLVLRLHNKLAELGSAASSAAGGLLDPGPMCTTKPKPLADPCESGAMTAVSTNLHFHGLSVPPVCHQDEVLKTSVQPSDGAFEYRFRIPDDEPPGLYWYHPHIHGFSSTQVSGGASGALIVEGIERANPAVAGLPERVFVIRDQPLLNPNAPPSKSEPAVPRLRIDRDGDVANNGTGAGTPAKDLSINFVPIPYPDYPPASITMRPGERQLWRVLNAGSVTYLDLALLFDGAPQQLGVVAVDGVSINAARPGTPRVSNYSHVLVPPGARVEFIVAAPAAGVSALLISRSVDTGQGGENDPNRPIASIAVSADAAEPQAVLSSAPSALPPSPRPWLGSVSPAVVRKLYFSEKLEDPNNPNSATTFYITVDGQTPAPFDPNAAEPNIVVHQGDVEDWIIENRTNELHAFHIHQIHFQLMQWSGLLVNEPFLRDTVNVPYFNGTTVDYPSVRLRMDFRDPNAVGTFVYHCHLLEHEDGGMMGTVRVVPVASASAAPGLPADGRAARP